MAIEPKRGCGYRKVGGIYLVAGSGGYPCHRLPVNLPICPVCGCGVKFARGWTWITPSDLFGFCPDLGNQSSGQHPCHQERCLVCMPPDGKHGLLWIGNQFYTPEEFIAEASVQGISRRISAVPRGFELGKTVVYLAHVKAGRAIDTEDHRQTSLFEQEVAVPAVFYVFIPERIEKIVTDVEAQDPDMIAELQEKGITPVIVPADDKDHNDEQEEGE